MLSETSDLPGSADDLPAPDPSCSSPATPVKERIALAPMEGVVDAGVRRLIGYIGGIDFAVTEFLRVTTELSPQRTFVRICPELLTNSCTFDGIPVHLQLLGSDPDRLAAHARRASEYGTQVVDLNFGCPAKTVNRHKGGAVLLQTPDQIFSIVSACSEALKGTSTRLTAKMRLGYENTHLVFDNLQAITEGGASELTVHARTKIEGYRPPAHWEWLARLKSVSRIPIIANGEIWTLEDYQRCREVSGCCDVMLGRGLLADPYLAFRIRHDIKELPTDADLAALLRIYLLQLEKQGYPEKFLLSRGKQWLAMMRQGRVTVDHLFEAIKVCRDAYTMLDILHRCSRQERRFVERLSGLSPDMETV